jgi:hypothetical protein
MLWRLHSALLKERLEETRELLLGLGDQVQVVSGRVAELPPPPETNGPALAMTTVQDARTLRWPGANPGLFWNRTAYDVSEWLPRVRESGVETLLRDAILLPWGCVRKPSEKLLSHLAGPEGRIFLKPNGGGKEFTGIDVSAEPGKFAEEIAAIERDAKGIADGTVVVLAAAVKFPELEWRTWIRRDGVVAWSAYSWNEDALGRPETAKLPETVRKAAETLGRSGKGPDAIFVADFIERENDAALIEINAASTSGIYSADISELIKALRDAVAEENADPDDGSSTEWRTS